MVYTKEYNKKGEFIGYMRELGNGIIESGIKTIPDDAEVIDNPPSQSEIAINQALTELQATDSKVLRIVEDFYAVLTPEQEALFPQIWKDAITEKQIKRQAYLDLL